MLVVHGVEVCAWPGESGNERVKALARQLERCAAADVDDDVRGRVASLSLALEASETARRLLVERVRELSRPVAGRRPDELMVLAKAVARFAWAAELSGHVSRSRAVARARRHGRYAVKLARLLMRGDGDGTDNLREQGEADAGPPLGELRGEARRQPA